MTPLRLLLALARVAIVAIFMGSIAYAVISLAGVDVRVLSTALSVK